MSCADDIFILVNVKSGRNYGAVLNELLPIFSDRRIKHLHKEGIEVDEKVISNYYEESNQDLFENFSLLLDSAKTLIPSHIPQKSQGKIKSAIEIAKRFFTFALIEGNTHCSISCYADRFADCLQDLKTAIEENNKDHVLERYGILDDLLYQFQNDALTFDLQWR